jgi:aspartyl-tRNA(Asn)/glutamyl-tRNA(Gln) amidotransferase subunit C
MIIDMSKINEAEIMRLAALANIGVEEEEAKALASELAAIVAMVEQLKQVDTAGLEETTQVNGLSDVWREDKIKPQTVSPADLLKNAPSVQDGYIKVKRVL